MKELYYAQIRSAQSSLSGTLRMDAGVFYINEKITSKHEACMHLYTLDVKLSAAVDQKGSKESKVLSTWVATVLTPKGDFAWASRGDSLVALFTYDTLTKKAKVEIVNRVDTPNMEIAYLKDTIETYQSYGPYGSSVFSEIFVVSPEQKQRLATLESNTIYGKMVAGSDTIAISRGFGSGRYIDKGFIHQSALGTPSISPSDNERIFVMTSSDGKFAPVVLNGRKEGVEVDDVPTTQFLSTLGDGVEHILVPQFLEDDELSFIHIDGEAIAIEDHNKFTYKGAQYEVSKSSYAYVDGKYDLELVIQTNGHEFAMMKYCEIIEECIEKNEAMHEKISNFARVFSTNDMLFSFAEITNPPEVSVASHIFDGIAGEAVSKQCAEVTTEFAKITGSKDIRTVIAKTKYDPEITSYISLAREKLEEMVEEKAEGEEATGGFVKLVRDPSQAKYVGWSITQ